MAGSGGGCHWAAKPDRLAVSLQQPVKVGFLICFVRVSQEAGHSFE
jgi:hypothetical protein